MPSTKEYNTWPLEYRKRQGAGFRREAGSALCFWNSITILLLHLPLLLRWIEQEHDKHQRQEGAHIVEDCFLCSFHTLAETYWFEIDANDSIQTDMNRLRTAFSRRVTTLAVDGDVQQDALELLEHIIALLEADTQDGRASLMGAESPDNHPLLARMFGIRTQEVVRCQRCEYTEQLPSDWQTSHGTTQSVASGRPQAIEAAAAQYIQPQLTMRQCAQCHAGSQVSFDTILDFPEMMILRVNRFGIHSKTSQSVRVSDRLILPSSQAEEYGHRPTTAIYQPRGLIFHHGERADSGHYTAACKSPGGSWAVFDDARCIRNQLLASIMQYRSREKDVYLVVYERISPLCSLADMEPTPHNQTMGFSTATADRQDTAGQARLDVQLRIQGTELVFEGSHILTVYPRPESRPPGEAPVEAWRGEKRTGRPGTLGVGRNSSRTAQRKRRRTSERPSGSAPTIQTVAQLYASGQITAVFDTYNDGSLNLNEIVCATTDDITRLSVDCIINAANAALQGGGGVDGAIHRAAGPGLKEECATILSGRECGIGEAVLTSGYNLPARHVIHTVGPDCRHSEGVEDVEALRRCYRASLQVAVSNHFASIAFPAISTGIYGVGVEVAAMVALTEVRDFLELSREPHTPTRIIFCNPDPAVNQAYIEILPIIFPAAEGE